MRNSQNGDNEIEDADKGKKYEDRNQYPTKKQNLITKTVWNHHHKFPIRIQAGNH